MSSKKIDKIQKEEVIQKYILENLNREECAKYFDISLTSFKTLLKKYSIVKDTNKVVEKRKETTELRYGTDSIFKNPEFKEKIKNTFIEKYGEDNPMKVDEIKEKVKNSVLDRYGVDNAMKSESVRKKVRETCIQKYGEDNPMKNKDICEKALITSIEKYGVSRAISLDEFKNKRKETCLNRYGSENFTSTEYFENKRKSTCINKYGTDFPNKNILLMKEFSTKELAEKFIKDNYFGKSISYIANDLNYNPTSVGNIIHKYELESLIDLKPKSSLYEEEIVFELKNMNIANIERNNRDILNGKEIDIYLPDYKIGIEFNGNFWHSTIYKNEKYHYEKSMLAEEKGIFIYHIFEYEWCDEIKRNKILNQLKNLLGKNTNKIYARKCEIKNVTKKDKSEFLNENHLQNNDRCTLAIGLYYCGELVSIMTFVKPRFNKKYDWELSRYCSKADTTVVGGASKLFDYFFNNYLNFGETIISYNDISKTKGNLYQTLSFYLDHISNPNYIWYKQNDIKTRYQCQMKNENKIMTESGYIKICDCGNGVWYYTKGGVEL